MINAALYKQGMREIWKTIFFLCLILTLYFSMIIFMFDPEIGNALKEFEKAMPELMAMIGMNTKSTTLIGFMSSYLYGFIMIIFPMVFSIICANKLMVRHVEKGSMAHLLAAPIKRRTIVMTQIKVLLTGIVIMVVYVTILGILIAEISFPGALDIKGYLLLNLANLCLHFFIAMICFIFSVIFNESRYALALGGGIPAMAYIIQMIAQAGEKYGDAKYFTFLTLFNPEGIIMQESSAFWGAASLFIGALVLAVLSILIFSRKDLHI